MKKVLKVFLTLLFLITCTSGIFAQRTVTGTVLDTEKQPVVGANVVVKGTNVGAITDINGKYTINVPSSSSIISFSFIGYVSKEAVAGNSSVIDMTLETEATALSEVVVIGYGTVKKRDITGSVASISGNQISSIPVSNAAQALTGKLAGVTVVSQDGRPDASISIRVRGGGSISQSNDPLFIVDGFPVSTISDIPGDQIESIDVLKDASSTAIYGARGANGVIIVTTKSPKGNKMNINYDGYVQFNEPTKYLETMNAYDYIAYNWAYARAISSAYADGWAQLWGIGSFAASSGNTTGIDYYKNVAATNFSKVAYGSSVSQAHNFNISDGNDKTKYLFAVNYVNNDGMKVNSWYKRTNVSFKLDHKIVEKLSVSFDFRYTDVDQMSNESTTNGKGSILSSSFQFRPIATSDVKGELNDQINTQIGMYDQVLQDRYNPVARMKDYSPEAKNRGLRSNASVNWTIVKGLTARSEVGLNNYWNKGYTWSGATYNDYLDASGNKTYGGDASISASEGWSVRWANTLSYDRQGLGSNQTLNVMVGQEVATSASSSLSISGKKYPISFDSDRAFAMMDQYYHDPNITNYSFSSNIGTPNNYLSFFGRVNYSLLNRYLLTVTFRADGSSRFAPTHKWGYFPAAAIGWRISEESFIKSISWINNLKLRASYGTVGNDAINANLWRPTWGSDGTITYSIGEVQQVSYSPATTAANPNLKWETTITRNLGLDYAFLKSRIYGTLDVYRNSTVDLLLNTPPPAISGFSSVFENVGSTSNTGVELAIGGDILRNKDYNLSVNFNININHGKIEELAPGITGLYKTQWGSSMTQPNSGDYILQVGEPVGLVRGYTYDGWYTIDDFTYSGGIYTLKAGVADIGSGILGMVQGTTANKPAGQSAYPGVIKFKDISGPAGIPDGIVNEYDVKVIGNMNPKHTGGLTINGNYKGLDLSLNFNWSYGNQIYNANYLAAMYGSKEDGLYKNRLNVLTNSYKIFDIQSGNLVSVTDTAALRALNANATAFLPYHENPICSTLGIEDGSFLRLNTVSLGYTLPKNLTSKAHISKLRFYGSIYNALTWTHYSGLDPEVNTNTSQGGTSYPTTGLDWGSYPRARSYTLGLNIEF
jgi:TonB-dependent starch-binding outer membrane protein SusC